MNWIDFLEASPTSWIQTESEKFSYQELIAAIQSQNITGPVFWKPEWTRSSLAILLAGLDSEWSVIVESGNKLPEIGPQGKGFFFISSSGTEGPSRFISHEKKVLRDLKPLYESKKASALLKPGHAAGIEFFLTGIKGMNNLALLSSAGNLSGDETEILHGPPSLLSFLMSFPSRYKDFLQKLSCFYSGTESLPPAVVTKVRNAGMSFTMEQIYGTTESWRIETLTHPEKPWLIKITDSKVEIKSGKIHYKNWFTGDTWKEFDAGWGMIESQRHWTATMMGEKINLLDLENEIMKKQGVVDVLASAQPGALGNSIQLRVFASPEQHDRLRSEIHSQTYTVEFLSPDKMSFQKKKRTEEPV